MFKKAMAEGGHTTPKKTSKPNDGLNVITRYRARSSSPTTVRNSNSNRRQMPGTTDLVQ